MNIHEYQAKQILRKFDIQSPEGIIAYNVDEVFNAALKIQSKFWVLKAQVHAGGRSKVGGVKIVKRIGEIKDEASKMFRMKIITPQTGIEGIVVNRVYVEAMSEFEKEYYVSLVLDRSKNCISIAGSDMGGVEIENVAKQYPRKIVTVHVDYVIGLQNFHIAKLGFGMSFNKIQYENFSKVITKLYNLFISMDATQIEINPLVITQQNQFIALDAKCSFDDNALYRHPDLKKMRDYTKDNLQEIKAIELNLDYIKMNGSIGCMVNGAGLAMATMDMIKLYGSEPANFLDVGGDATTKKITQAFEIILSDTNIKGILINIFAGIMKCDAVANGIIEATKKIDLDIPIVTRLEGTNSKEGKEILQESNLKIKIASNLEDAVKKIIKAINKIKEE